MEAGDEGYKRTASGLLRKRAEILDAMTETKERAGALANDLETIERALVLVGYDGDLPTQRESTRVVMYYRNELRAFVRKELQAAAEPLSTRDLAVKLMELEGRDANDRRLRSDMIRRIGSALAQLRDHGVAKSEKRAGEVAWRWVKATG